MREEQRMEIKKNGQKKAGRNEQTSLRRKEM